MFRRLCLVIGFATTMALGMGSTSAIAQEADDESYAEEESGEGFEESDEEWSDEEGADEEAVAEDEDFAGADADAESEVAPDEEFVDATAEPETGDEEPSAPEPPPSPPQPVSAPAQPMPAQQRSASSNEQQDTTIYKVVVNQEEQYSIWPADRDNPLGWNDAGKTGTKAECLEYIQNVWTDTRPLSLRKKMEEAERARGDQ